jgi:hypothetical protein
MPIIDYFCGIEIALAANVGRDENRARLVALAEGKKREKKKKILLFFFFFFFFFFFCFFCFFLFFFFFFFFFYKGRFRSTLQSLPDHAPTFFQWGKMLYAQALKANNQQDVFFTSCVEKLRNAIEIDSLNSEFQQVKDIFKSKQTLTTEKKKRIVLIIFVLILQTMANVLLDFGKILLQKAIFEGHGKTSLRQALDKFKEALRLTPVASGEKRKRNKIVVVLSCCLFVMLLFVCLCLVVCV